MHYLTDPLQFEFMRRALMAIVLTGIASGVLGSYVVLRGLAFIGDALTHAVFPGIVVAVALGRSILLGALVVGLITALGIATVSRGRRVSEDTAIGILFAAMFALGVVLVSTLAAYQRDVADLLFGQILAVSQSDLYLAAGTTAVAVVTTVLLNKELSLIGFDRDMALAMRYPVFLLDLVLLGLITLAIVVSLQSSATSWCWRCWSRPRPPPGSSPSATMQLLSAALGVAAAHRPVHLVLVERGIRRRRGADDDGHLLRLVFTAVEAGRDLRPRGWVEPFT
jgi:ABC-type Mn2+/Zn2+ transport system permease subunit